MLRNNVFDEFICSIYWQPSDLREKFDMTTPAAATAYQPDKRKVTDFLSKEEIQYFRARSDARGLWGVFSVWAGIGMTMTTMALAVDHLPQWAAAFVLAAGLVILAGRHLGLVAMMHDASHGTLFKTRWLNDVFTNWAAAKIVWNDVIKFRAHHMVHHANTTASFDPDLPLYSALPVSRASMTRKFLRDLIGLTGLKFLVGRTLMSAGVLKWSDAIAERANNAGWPLHRHVTTFLKDFWPTALTNALLYMVLAATGHGWLYACFVLAYLIPFMLIVRIRSLAEHAGLEIVPDTLRNTRTTRTSLLSGLTMGALNINYHQEHHLVAACPYYRLPELHKTLRARNYVPEPWTYLGVLRACTTLPAQPQAQA